MDRIRETAATRHVAARARAGTVTDGADDVESQLDALLDRVKGDDEARQQFVDLLELLGPEDPRTADYPSQAHRPPVLSPRFHPAGLGGDSAPGAV